MLALLAPALCAMSPALCAMTPALCAAPPAPPAACEGLGAVRAALVRKAPEERATSAQLVSRLTALGPPAIPGLFRVVTGEGIEELFAATPGGEEPDFLCEPDVLGGLALEALARLPASDVVDHLRLRLAQAPERDVRLAEMRVLTALGQARGLELVLEIARGLGHEILARPVREPLRTALTTILRSDEAAYSLLATQLPELGDELVLLVAEALEQEPDGAGILVEILGRGPALERRALEALVALEDRLPWRVHLDVRAQVRSRLTHPNDEVRCAALLAVGRLHDADSLPALITCLEDGSAEAARAAQWSLQQVAGERESRQAGDWNAWVKAETAWLREEGALLRSELGTGEGSKMVASLRELLPHRMARDPVVEELVLLLPDLAPELQTLACDTLGRLGSRAAVPALVDLLSGEERAVREAAGRALRALCGQDLPAEPQPWEEYAFG